MDLVYGARRNFTNSQEFKAQDRDLVEKGFKSFCLEGMKGFFNAITDKKYVVDKGRGWGAYYDFLSAFQDSPKVVCMVRDIRCIYSSMEKIYRKSHALSTDIIEDASTEANTTAKRVDIWAKSQPFGISLDRLEQILLEKTDKYLLFVRYEDFVRDPQNQMNRVYDYFGVPRYNHNFSHIEQITHEDDKVYGSYDFHTIQNELTINEPDFVEVLGKDTSMAIRQGYDWFYKYFNYK